MKRRKLVFLGLLVTSCSDAPDREVLEPTRFGAARSGSENRIAKASANRSLIFPLTQDANRLPNFTRVKGREAGEMNVQELIFAVINCGTGLSWYEQSSHWEAIVVPSSSSTIWENVKTWHPSDEEIVNCVRRLYPRTFSYTVRDVGYDTFESTFIDDALDSAAQR
ncbi:hypothetical protein SH591_02750 [Sphingomonas sp. LY54]|uniref:hypothetical protein n=1 Tax=Sphingomonas sp. LY54 TaxID=3095343 RepID=UPI002D79F8ED|nr:hypothetical protein [Sphingomonas sp. LY54]WRP29118.1 hypothetical protein SH591_02750 [Sphingomonas sp. LY54]